MSDASSLLPSSNHSSESLSESESILNTLNVHKREIIREAHRQGLNGDDLDANRTEAHSASRNFVDELSHKLQRLAIRIQRRRSFEAARRAQILSPSETNEIERLQAARQRLLASRPGASMQRKLQYRSDCCDLCGLPEAPPSRRNPVCLGNTDPVVVSSSDSDAHSSSPDAYDWGSNTGWPDLAPAGWADVESQPLPWWWNHHGLLLAQEDEQLSPAGPPRASETDSYWEYP
ncbi:hypothetical protein C8F01DRAFT_1255052 [Mycena amicta]|nr:hypothetical protein C8F01DRAFT_1255052 [Mycena amicta]